MPSTPSRTGGASDNTADDRSVPTRPVPTPHGTTTSTHTAPPCGDALAGEEPAPMGDVGELHAALVAGLFSPFRNAFQTGSKRAGRGRPRGRGRRGTAGCGSSRRTTSTRPSRCARGTSPWSGASSPTRSTSTRGRASHEATGSIRHRDAESSHYGPDPVLNSGGGGIRTHGAREGTSVFKTDAFDHSATPPDRTEEKYDRAPAPALPHTTQAAAGSARSCARGRRGMARGAPPSPLRSRARSA